MSVNSEKILLPDVRLSYANIWRPRKFDDDSEPRFEATGLLDPTLEKHQKTIAKITSEFERICKEQWGKVPQKLKGKPFGLADEDELEYDGWAGMFYFAANTKPTRPKIVDRNPNIVLTEEDGRPYAGCYVNLSVQMWADARKVYGPRINGTLRAIQFYRDGEAFSGAGPINAADEFEDVSDEVDDGSFLDD